MSSSSSVSFSAAEIAIKLLRRKDELAPEREAFLCHRIYQGLLARNRAAALHYLKRAVSLSSSLDYAESVLQMARQFSRQCDFPVAKELYTMYFRLRPDDWAVVSEHASFLFSDKKLTLSLERFQTIPTAYLSSCFKTQKDYGMALLAAKQFVAGFAFWEARLQCSSPPFLDIPSLPFWKNLEQETCNHLLLIDEQGIGDTIQFFRFALHLSACKPATTISFCPKPSASSLFLDSYAQGKIQVVTPKWIDKHAHLFDRKAFLCSLPHLIGISHVTQLTHLGPSYLRPPKEKTVHHWQTIISEMKRPHKIGFCLRGSNLTCLEKNLDFALTVEKCFASFYQKADFVCLNRKQDYLTEIARADMYDFVHFFPLDEKTAFADTSAIVYQMDLVITVDTAVAHLAATMGKPVWLMLGALSDWRWFGGDEYQSISPWYDSMRIFRASIPNQFEAVFPDIRSSLEAWLCQDSSQS